MKRLNKLLIWAVLAIVAAIAVGLYPVTTPAPQEPRVMTAKAPAADLSAFSDSVPDRPLNLLFIHHSVGGQLLADAGPSVQDGKTNIYRTSPNGGGLRARLEAQHYVVHEASYSSILGEPTDLFDWLPKFKTQMPRILATRYQDALLPQGKNDIVMFKSCFPNSAFQTDPGGPGNPAGPILTLSNAKATMLAVRDELAKQPQTLFVYLTAPPLVARETREPLWKYMAKKILGRPTRDVEQVSGAADARAFNNWVKSPAGWLKGYPGHNIVVFDYYDILTGGDSNFLRYPSNGGKDDHPTAEGQRKTTAELVPFLNRAIRYAGIVQ